MRRWLAAGHQAGDGLAADAGLYVCSALFAGITALSATLPPHAAWGKVAFFGYAAASVITGGQLLARRLDRVGQLNRAGNLDWAGNLDRIRQVCAGDWARLVLTTLAWVATTLVPLVAQAVARADGHPGRAQEEVIVVEQAGQRLIDEGSPYLSRAAIAALPKDDRLLGYLPYQPGMSLFGVPRAMLGTAWFTDARVWFALVTAVTVGLAGWLAHRHGGPMPALVRATQAATVLPVCALTLAVGGDDLPVLGLCLLALTCAAVGRFGLAGVAVGLAGAMKLFAWPVALVLLALVIGHRMPSNTASAANAAPGETTSGSDPGPAAGRPAAARPARIRRAVATYLLGALGLPVLALAPAVAVDPGAAIENVGRFPLGLGLVHSPAASPFPGHLLATGAPGGRMIVMVLLILAGLVIGGTLVFRPPTHAGAAAGICAIGLLTAILLMPSTRFGYLLYPAAYALWVPVLTRVDQASRVTHSDSPRPAPQTETRESLFQNLGSSERL